MSRPEARGEPGKYTPSPRVAEILIWCLAKINEVAYEVTLRWIFYRASQEKGLTKHDYNVFKQWTSRARHKFWNGWMPDTLVDDTRSIIVQGEGFSTPREWLEALHRAECVLDKRETQQRVVVVCFEAEAMKSQFEHYCKPYHVTMVPFKGDATIEPKWRLAKFFEELYEAYGKPILVLYFGDLDDKGVMIPESAFRDIRAWCSAPFEFEWVGLTQEQVDKWHIPENFEKPGYQWEALPDSAAREIIQGALNKYVDLAAIRAVEALEKATTEKWRNTKLPEWSP